jgi:DNA-binding MarR family transcriptional regulator
MRERAVHAEVGELIGRVGRVARGLQFVNGLSPAQWESLRYVARANRYSRCPSALAAFLGTTKGTVSQTLIALEGKGYMHRERSNPDRRGVRLELTAAGEALLERDPLLHLDAAAAALPRAARKALVDGLVSVLRGVQRQVGATAFGMCEECSKFCADGASADPGGPHRCGLTGEALNDNDRRLICVIFEARH